MRNLDLLGVPKDMQQVTLLDGGMGQELFLRSNKPASPLFSAQAMLDDPEMVIQLHYDFISAGADLICINSYAATPERLARDADISVFAKIQKAAVRAALIARDNSQKPVRIAGCLPPLVASYHTELIPPENQARASYELIIQQQTHSVDLFIAETMSSVAEARYVCDAVANTDKPVWVSFTVDDRDGAYLRSGEALMAGVEGAVTRGAEVVLVNCSTPEAVGQSMAILAKQDLLFGGMANGYVAAAELKAGDTVDTLATRDDLDPNGYAEHAMSWVEQGATMIGGCCGVGPAHIAELRRRIDMA
jgi:homocysteine S-methyltransferase